MSPNRPFNSLGQILASGGEIALAQAIWLGKPPAYINALFDAKFEPMTPDDRAALTQHAEDMVASAERITQQSRDEPLENADIPTNENPSWDDSNGDRLKWVGEWRIPGTERWFRVSGTFPINTTGQDLFRYLAGIAQLNIKASPKRFGLADDDQPPELDIRITASEKA